MLDQVRTEILPLLDEIARQESVIASRGGSDFFLRVRDAIAAARDVDDLGGPFMELATTAFRGFVLDAQATVLVDQLLERAQLYALLFSSRGEPLQ
jgi:hypothetical protein